MSGPTVEGSDTVDDPLELAQTAFPSYMTAAPAPHHMEAWGWLSSIKIQDGMHDREIVSGHNNDSAKQNPNLNEGMPPYPQGVSRGDVSRGAGSHDGLGDVVGDSPPKIGLGDVASPPKSTMGPIQEVPYGEGFVGRDGEVRGGGGDSGVSGVAEAGAGEGDGDSVRRNEVDGDRHGGSGGGSTGDDGHGVSRIRPFVAIWPREHGKSAFAEMATACLGALGRRRFALYVSGTQKQANDHVESIRQMFEKGFGEGYAHVTERRVGKYGASQGWTQSRLRTPTYAVDAIGLDTGVRGIRDLEARPDFIVLDDIDNHDDSPLITDGKLNTITRSIVPSGTSGCVVLAIQNLVHPDGIFARLSSDAPPFIMDRILSGPIPAIEGLGLEGSTIKSGTPTWPERKGIAACQADIIQWGLESWLQEAQHEVGLRLREGLVLGTDDDGVRILDNDRNLRPRPALWRDCKWRVVAVDPGGDGDATAVGALGVTADERHHVYVSRKIHGNADLLRLNDILGEINAEGPIHGVFVGETGGDTIVKTLQRMGWPARKAVMDRSMLMYLRGLLKTGRLTIEPEESHGLIEESKSWWWKKVSEPTKTYVKQYDTITGKGHHADEWDAVRYGVASILQGLPGAPQRQIGRVARDYSAGRIGRRRVVR